MIKKMWYMYTMEYYLIFVLAGGPHPRHMEVLRLGVESEL